MKRIKHFKKLSFLFFLFSIFIGLNPVSASNPVDQKDKTLSPYFVVLCEHPETDQLPLKSTSASVNIVGVIADVTIRQEYANTGKNTLEAIYTFPLSTKAAVYALKMKIGKRVIVAKIKEKEKARKEYEKAKSEGNRVSLLEQNRPNVFTMKVANIGVNDVIVVEIQYTELLVPEKGRYSFIYPTVVGPRYSNKNEKESGTDDQFIKTPYTKESELPSYKFNFNCKINSGIAIQNISCTTHKINVKHTDINTAAIQLAPDELKAGNRDLIIDYSLQGNKIESGIMLFENGDENFFLMMIQPPKKVLAPDIPAREYIFIVDVSGSMSGFPLDISKKLLRNLIVNLKPTDKFNVVIFAGSAGLFSKSSVNANKSNIEQAISFIDNQHGGGGTELITALKTAQSIPQANENISRSFILVSDGYVSVEKEAFDLVRMNNNNCNFFSFGIGSSVNRYIMEGLAFMGNGEPMIVVDEQKSEIQAERFRSYINSPVLTQIKTIFGDLETYDIEPYSIPDLLAERPLIIFGKYKGKATGKATIEGLTSQGTFSETFDLSKIKPALLNSPIQYLWARERIKLLDYYNSPSVGFQNENNNYKEEITSLGLKYNLMTAYTSFIAIDENFIVDKNVNKVTVKQPLPLPQGVSNQAVEASDCFVIEETTSMLVEEDDEVVFQVVETMPKFVGGDAALKNYLSQNIKYPEKARLSGIQGRVILQFDVDIDGSIVNIVVVRSVSPELDAEAIRVTKLMPKWLPGKQRGKRVRVKYTMPVNFKLS